MKRSLLFCVSMLSILCLLSACSTIEPMHVADWKDSYDWSESYDWEEDPARWLRHYRSFRVKHSNTQSPHWILHSEPLQSVGVLPVSLDPRLIDSHPMDPLQASDSYANLASFRVLMQLQPQLTAAIKTLLPHAPDLPDLSSRSRLTRPDVFWGTAAQFRYIRAGYPHTPCCFRLLIFQRWARYPSTIQGTPPYPRQSAYKESWWDNTQKLPDGTEPRFLVLLDEKQNKASKSQQNLEQFSATPGVSHWLMLRLSVKDSHQWLATDADGYYQHDFVVQALLLDTAGRVQQVKISPFTLRWRSSSLLLSEQELATLQPSWQIALQDVLKSFALLELTPE